MDRVINVPDNLAVNSAGNAVLELQVHLGDGVVGEDRGIRDITCKTEKTSQISRLFLIGARTCKLPRGVVVDLQKFSQALSFYVYVHTSSRPAKPPSYRQKQNG
jgi:hypothetical protein